MNIADLKEAEAVEERADILRCASRLATTPDPATIVTHALPLMQFLDEAATPADRTARLRALMRHDRNRSDHNVPRDNDPAGFVTAARVLYEFLAHEGT